MKEEKEEEWMNLHNSHLLEEDIISKSLKSQRHMYLVTYHHGISNEKEKDEKVELIMNTLGDAVPFRGDCVWFLYSDRAAKDIYDALRQVQPLWGIAVVEISSHNNWVVKHGQFAALAKYVNVKYSDNRFIPHEE